MQVTNMNCNNEEAIDARQLLLSDQAKRSVYEKHMPIKKRAWKMDARTGSDGDDKITEKVEECDIREPHNVGIHCPRCDFVIPQKRSRGSEPFNVTNDQSGALSGGNGLKANEPAGFDTDFEKDREEKKQKGSDFFEESCMNGNDIKKNGKEIKTVEHNPELSEVDNNDNKKPGNEYTEVPTLKFYEFSEDRKEECFVSDQLWAVYDHMDGIPRCYAWIRKVLSPGFKVRITWLEANPVDQDEIDWVSEHLPVSCGKFKYGKSEITEDIKMFSHSAVNAKSTSRGFFEIYPKKGETWALFRNWHIKWRSDAQNHRKYEFDFVEILSDCDEGSGVSVAYLEKVKGFVSLFSPKKEVASFHIPPNELYRFSHMVPSYRMTGKERDGVSEGSFELDPASLPVNLMEDIWERLTLPQKRQKSALPSQRQPRAGNSFGNMTRTKFTSVNLHREWNQQELDQPTFWTACSFCNMGYQYSKDMLNRVLQCQNCMKPFLARGFNFQDHASLPANLVEDIKERSTIPQQRRNSYLSVQKRPGGGYSGHNSRTQFRKINLCREQNRPGPDRATFWTACPFCNMRYQYYRDVLRRSVGCQNCKKTFIAYGVNVQGLRSGANWKGV